MPTTVFKVLSGSKLYGTATEQSDTDTMEATVPSEAHQAFCIGWDWRCSGDQKIGESKDERIHDVRRFLHLACRGQTAFLESIFASPRHVLSCIARFGLEIDGLQKNLPTSQMNLVGPTLGYATSELRAAFGETTGKLGVDRKEVLAKFGYSPKNAHHGLRILGQTLECLQGDRFTPYPNEHKAPQRITGHQLWMNFLMDVKIGKVRHNEVRRCFDLLIRELESYHVSRGEAVRNSVLPLVDHKERGEAVNAAISRIMEHCLYQLYNG